ncbi:fluoride efflux transporter CrcB [Saccharibacillus kuerlensis]|uniref:Fluoride-specific ion channel FluC n=1 Tax=Saccharibacillus kuerlensis TaxID=459527 RepID=A0ABQ2KYW6_9BACL|nr:fluoride efflux transporter CrcB [Saccharibacillus kuerlensis]GGN97389.1 putative fluoride ion transporter CrcB 1 [Saccharibacillus kuerlensis]
MKDIVYVALGGICGALLRYALSTVIPQIDGFPLPTLLINLSGCLFLGLFFTLALDPKRISSAVRIGIGTGLTGAFTTFSTFSVETIWLLENDRIAAALLYAGASLVGGIALSILGVWLGGIWRERSGSKGGQVL